MIIKMSEYAKRRKELTKQLGPNSIVILPSSKELYRSGDTQYAYRQNSDFYYLTGFNEPEAVFVLIPKRKEGEFILFSRTRDRSHEIWNGPRAGLEGARELFGADQAFPIDEFTKLLPDFLMGKEAIHYPLGINHEFDDILLESVNKIRSKIRSGFHSPIAFVDITPTLHEMRLFKSPAEISVMQKAVDITKDAHVRAMRTCKPGLYEYELEAEMMYEFLKQGSRYPAYSPIVGSGHNTCILHYVNNDKKIKDGELVLIDAGAEYQNYAADITRTFPAKGIFTAEQRAIYEIVLASQLAAIKATKPGVSWMKTQEVIVKIITQGLIDLKILKGKLDDLVENQAYSHFYMHRSGHWLGLDVHDVGRYRINDKWRTLEPGMVFTIEPGIYIPKDHSSVHKRWHDIGVRIEDDIVVTKNGCEVLSKDIPKTIKDIEALMKS